MDGGQETFLGAIPGAFSFIGDVIFRWVPATVSVFIANVSGTTSPYENLSEPVAAWNVPALLEQTSNSGTYLALVKSWFVFSVITLALSAPFLGLVLYCWIRIIQIRRAERREVEAVRRTVVTQDVPRTQLRWNRITEGAASPNPESWRLAILEADIMLNELLDLQGYKGETIADKMKQVDRAKFNSIDAAWEAHKIRNRVAHEGTTADLDAREARRVIGLYERVFKEFHYIG